LAQSDNGLRTDITGQYSNPKYGTEIIKKYEYESPNSIYALQLTLLSEKSPQNVESNISDIARFAPIIDRVVQTVKLNE